MRKIKNLPETFIYKTLNKNNRLTLDITKISQTGTQLSQSNLEEAFIKINKNFNKFPLKSEVMRAVESKEIILMYAPKGVKLNQCMGYFLTVSAEKRVVAVVNVDLYGTMNEAGDVNIDVNKLYGLLEGAYIGLLCFNYKNALRTKPNILSNGSTVYANIITRVLNKKYSLATDRNKQNKITFLAAKFFLVNLLGMDFSDAVDNYAMKACVNPNPVLLDQLSDSFPEEAFEDFASFIQELVSNPDTKDFLPGLTVTGFLEQFINMYSATMLLSLESFQYFMYNINGVLCGSYINNQYILEEIIDKFGVKLYAEIAKLR